MESAYDNLQDMLGPGGMKGLTNETKKLISQQKSLMESLNTMTPILKTAKDTLKNVGDLPNMSELNGMVKKLAGMKGGKRKLK